MRKDEFPIVDEYCRRAKIEELEKIKTEIEEIDNIIHEHGATYINKYGIVKVFNNHISELKGGNADSENEIYCDRNICLQNEYNNIGCEDCVVTKGENEE